MLFNSFGRFPKNWGGENFAEHLLNYRLQMRASSATRRVVTLTKQMKIGLCEQVRVILANRRIQPPLPPLRGLVSTSSHQFGTRDGVGDDFSFATIAWQRPNPKVR